MWYLLPFLFSMYSKDVAKHLHTLFSVDQILIVELVCKERLTFLSCKAFELVKLWVKFVRVSHLNKIVALSPKESLILQVFKAKHSDWIFRLFANWLLLCLQTIDLSVLLLIGLAIVLSHHKLVEEEVCQLAGSVDDEQENYNVFPDVPYPRVLSEIVFTLLLCILLQFLLLLPLLGREVEIGEVSLSSSQGKQRLRWIFEHI